mmetsp:Transcript_2905/g.7399  ORF Transcript_2905/g.7399 Transcript_2905/m.7399 type:complete len:217 (-) Transcript_2905:379-1029(-)
MPPQRPHGPGVMVVGETPRLFVALRVARDVAETAPEGRGGLGRQPLTQQLLGLLLTAGSDEALQALLPHMEGRKPLKGRQQGTSATQVACGLPVGFPSAGVVDTMDECQPMGWWGGRVVVLVDEGLQLEACAVHGLGPVQLGPAAEVEAGRVHQPVGRQLRAFLSTRGGRGEHQTPLHKGVELLGRQLVTHRGALQDGSTPCEQQRLLESGQRPLD